ncbi:MAG: lamin tail domain-containing protein, partial [Thermoanaerobaculia bacterium]
MELPRGIRKFAWALLLPGLVAWGCSRSSRHAAPIAINEVMASGGVRPLLAPDGTPLANPAGETSDWVEVYNPLSHPVNLASYTLSDNPRDPRKYRFPPLVLQPGEFVVVILDNDPGAGPLHAGFQLRGSGEEVLLYGKNGGVVVDRRTFRELEPDATAGRYPDGAPDYGVIYAPTPGRPNKRIGIRPPRFDGAPQVSPEADP